jgi:pilus assembly protein Flp/PilA
MQESSGGNRIEKYQLQKSGSAVMRNTVVRFVKDESGATAIEYGLIAALIAVGIITAARLLGSQISATFNTVATTMQSA